MSLGDAKKLTKGGANSPLPENNFTPYSPTMN